MRGEIISGCFVRYTKGEGLGQASRQKLGVLSPWEIVRSQEWPGYHHCWRELPRASSDGLVRRSLLRVGDFTVDEGDFEVLVNVDLLCTEGDDFIGLADGSGHLIGRLAELNAGGWRRWLSGLLLAAAVVTLIVAIGIAVSVSIAVTVVIALIVSVAIAIVVAVVVS